MDRHNKVLIVEDDISSQQYYTYIFRNKYEIRMVSTIHEAKQALQEETFKIALVDFSLPGGENGLDLIKHLHEEYPNGNPVSIALTAHVFPQNKVEAFEAGAVEFLTKPIMSKVLLEVIAKYSSSPPSED